MASLSPRLWSDRDLNQKYILMDEDREADEVSSISIVADPDRTNKDEENTIDDIDDDDDDESTSPFTDLSLKEVISIDETGTSIRAPLTRREKLMRIINSIWWQAVVVLLIVVDVVLLGLQLYGFYGHSEGAKNMEKRFDDNEPLTNLSISIVVILLAEVLVRVIVFGRYFWSEVLNIFDLIVMVVSFIIMLVVVNHYAHSIFVLLRIIRVAARLVRIVIKVWQGKKNINQAVRTVVTENKQRYTKDGWDLDLAYVTDRIIVSSLPAYNFQSLYRNHIDDVVRFLDTKHLDSYLVVNCCAEKYADYPISKFHDRVRRYYIEDHNTGTLSQLLEACENMQRWQDENPNNIVFVHCKGGKGRSGSVICTFMLYSGICSNADEALDLFARKRTDPTKPGRLQGVETASQRRYVDYFSTIVNNGKVLPPSASLSITKLSVRLISPDNLQNLYQLAPFASVTHNNGAPVSGVILKRRDKYESYDTNEMSAEYEGPNIVAMNDVRLMVFLEEKIPNKKTGKKREIYFFYFWFHTAFVTHVYPLALSKHEVDRNRKWKRSPFAKLKSLNIEVHFTPV